MKIFGVVPLGAPPKIPGAGVGEEGVTWGPELVMKIFGTGEVTVVVVVTTWGPVVMKTFGVGDEEVIVRYGLIYFFC
jgi:hypothetical protein